MSKILRVGFAMGGGVSLGTFCGTALTQALKLLIVYGRDRNGAPYDRVVVDVFSGASAGALALAAMLRSLLRRDASQEAAASAKLQTEFGDRFNALGPEARKDLIAAQVAQEMQKELWTREIKLAKLLDPGAIDPLRYQAALLNRHAVDDIARRHLVQWEGGVDFSGRRLLDDRVLYACTLSNLTPLVADARAEFAGSALGYIGLNDGMRSHSHRDLRVFDLNFKKITKPTDDRYPDRWCLYHAGPARDGLAGDLRDATAWAQIAATAIASGGFPIAFEPVVLTRKAFEYGPRLWSSTFNRPLPRKKSDFNGGETYPFTFVDGGVFNNEPIRECFRLASFIETYANTETPDEKFDRLVVFVDPNVSPSSPSFAVPCHRRWMVESPNFLGSLDGFDLRRSASLDRLLPHLGTLLGAIGREGGVIEADKIFQVRDRFKLRDGIRASLQETLTDGPGREALATLIAFCGDRLATADRDEMIPAGPLSLAGELRRVMTEEADRGYADLWPEVDAFLAREDPASDPHRDRWLRLLNFVAIDLILGLEGKIADAQLVAIAPFRNLRTESLPGGKTRAAADEIKLPGGSLSAFAGFMSDVPDQVEHRAARYCAAEFLRACGWLDPQFAPPPATGLELDADQLRQYERDVEKGLRDLGARVQAMVANSGLIRIAPGLDAILSTVIAHFLRKKVSGIDWRDRAKARLELRVTVPNERFELDGRGIGDQDCAPVRDTAGAPWQLITDAEFDVSAGTWEGGFVHDGRLVVDEDSTGFMPDRSFCEIELPGAAQVATALTWPNPVFVLGLAKEHKGQVVPAAAWQLEPGVRTLEELLKDPAVPLP